MNYHQEQIVKNCCAILENIYASLDDNYDEDDEDRFVESLEEKNLKNAINALRFIPKSNVQYSEDIIKRAAQLKEQWNNCQSDSEKMLLAQKSGEIIFLLDEDYTICNLYSNNKEAVKIFGDFLLSNCIGNSHDTHVLLSLLNIPHKDA